TGREGRGRGAAHSEQLKIHGWQPWICPIQ
ncbi:unnamed protein product, partial [marine sediment metagenome]